jgi:hypothetical protein
LLEIEPPALDLDQVFDDVGGGFLFRANKQRQTVQQLGIRKLSDGPHAYRLTSVFPSSSVAHCASFTSRMSFEVA